MNAPLCYFLAYRVREWEPNGIPWHRPTGGLVMEPLKIVNDIAVSDFKLAGEILAERYHCDADQVLCVAECFAEPEQNQAVRLHHQYDMDLEEFRELMRVSDSA